ncbi:hypothetical protein EAL2_808p03930 (plasmid) [Peptoclostridium acidaminophilum DSM 3953]|uniref:YjeF C-terminal domain-containing protein n=1 Tax=Peptoclostridium acidaminophilum DSM 3953 TaxID=1286171 RepID=W8TP14_PEPAC|nr:NAD(P)H-hydrate dehydratase [Peptoclostridium acidaminophilum]AHM57897.1 hypothetical protein EAL2_808p03930 [Peptoclostridium acidaminophilum DSM 3953]
MFGIIGAIPNEKFPLIAGTVLLEKDRLVIGDENCAISRGTPAMIAAAVETLKYLGKPSPFCFLVGDIGNGKGCIRLYKHLAEHLPETAYATLTFHYFQPYVVSFQQVMDAINTMSVRPTLIADAGFMYVAKMSGLATSFDLFTPDAGELAYLADEEAPHPFYTRGFILDEKNYVPDLIERAYLHNNASHYLLVKGETDYIANRDGIISIVNNPVEEVLEAIGGTGDTLTGIVSALIASGMEISSAATMAARVNRLAGCLAKPTPATQIIDIIRHIPQALEEVLGKEDLQGL